MDNETNNELDWLWFCSITGLDWKRKNMLIRYFGSPKEICAHREELLSWKQYGLSWVTHADTAIQSREKLQDQLLKAMQRNDEASGIMVEA